MSSMEKVALGLDFGGTKLAAGIVALGSTNARLICSARRPTRQESGAAGAVDDMLVLARGLSGVESIECIGVSFGGHVRDNRILRSLHIEGWENYPLVARLQAEFGVSQVRVANDANAAALSEWRFGAGQGAESLLYVTVSTGIGGGVVINGGLWEGVSGLAAEIGHTRIVPDGPRCTCGRAGCLEAVAAGPAIVRRAIELLHAQPRLTSLLREIHGFSAADVAQLAQSGDVLAVAVIIEAACYLGIGIANALNLLDVERVVIGGGVSRSGSLWWRTVCETIRQEALPWRQPIDVWLSAPGSDEGIWGAVAIL